MAYLVCDRPLYFDETKHRIAQVDAISGSVFKLLEHRFADVKFKKTKEEKDARRRFYRQEYMKRPAVVEKLKKRLADPETIAARKRYAEREDVKKRKKELAKQNREIPAKLKKKAPKLYQEIISEVRQPTHQPIDPNMSPFRRALDKLKEEEDRRRNVSEDSGSS